MLVSVDSVTQALDVDRKHTAKISGDVVRSVKVLHEVDDLLSGVWEVKPGTFRGDWGEGIWEIFVVTSGRGAFTSDEGDVHELKPGVLVTISPNTHGVWEVTETLRKAFVLPRRNGDLD